MTKLGQACRCMTGERSRAPSTAAVNEGRVPGRSSRASKVRNWVIELELRERHAGKLRQADVARCERAWSRWACGTLKPARKSDRQEDA